MDDHDPGDVFKLANLWRPSSFLSAAEPEHNSLLFSSLSLHDIDVKLPPVVEPTLYDDDFFCIPDLSFGPTEEFPTPSLSTESHANSDESSNEDDRDNDIWLLPDETKVGVGGYQSWEQFEAPRHKEPKTSYITEGGASVFDAAVVAEEDYLRLASSEHVVVNTQTYISSLLALGLGRSSILFFWDEEQRCFKPNLAKLRISGISSESLDSSLVSFMECGNITRHLQNFVNGCYSRNYSPGQIALADTVSTLLVTIQSRLSNSSSENNTLLQLQISFRPAHSILICFQRIVRNVTSTRSDEAMLSTIFQEIQLLEHRTDSLREILLETLSRVSQPWLEFTAEWVGLQREVGLPLTKDGRSKNFVKVDNREWVDEQGLEMREPDFILDYDKIPAFMAPEDARSMFEVGRSLRFLKEHHPDHPLARPDVIAAANPPSLSWKFSWDDILNVEAKAQQYERELASTLRHYSKPGAQDTQDQRTLPKSNSHELEIFGKPEEDMHAHILAIIDSFDQPLRDALLPDRLASELGKYLLSKSSCEYGSDPIFAPPVSLVPLLSFNPIISAQARVVNGTCMRMFFKSHNLREHLSLQHKFHLLGNGVFSSRLSHALFDPELESAERHRGVARSGGIMGLRLGGRETWPPASSELRLALMNVLTDSYPPANSYEKSSLGTFLDHTSLPGDMSFAVRDMSDEEIEKCMDPDSNEALDFLRLSYKPPPPLGAVLTSVILYKYDQLFKLLLRVLRMLYVVSALYRGATDRTRPWLRTNDIARKFRIEAHHFISSVSGYFFDTGIESTWKIFERKLDELETQINGDDGNVILGQNEGLDKLRDYHERVLDKIMFALFLRKRQQPIMNLLEEIFALVLQFSKSSREQNLHSMPDKDRDDAVSDIYYKFRKKVGVFITVCRGLSEKKGYGDKRSTESNTLGHEGMFDSRDLAEENTVSHLLARLEMSNYYSEVVKQ